MTNVHTLGSFWTCIAYIWTASVLLAMAISSSVRIVDHLMLVLLPLLSLLPFLLLDIMAVVIAIAYFSAGHLASAWCNHPQPVHPNIHSHTHTFYTRKALIRHTVAQWCWSNTANQINCRRNERKKNRITSLSHELYPFNQWCLSSVRAICQLCVWGVG